MKKKFKSDKSLYIGNESDLIDIPGWSSDYAITPTGQVYNKKQKFWLIWSEDIRPTGTYYYVRLRNTLNKQVHISIHRLLALTFIPNPEHKPTVDHINRIPSDNRLENLRWATFKEQSDNSANIFKVDELQKAAEQKASLSVSKPVEMRDKDNHSILIKTFSSSFQAAIQEFNNSNNASLITRCCKGKKPSAYGYYWTFVN